MMGNPIRKPIKITHPTFAPTMLATAMGPGVGGIKACPQANPANKGIAYNNNDFPVFFCMEKIMGASSIKPTSKKTGIETIRPVKARATGAYLSPDTFKREFAIAIAPPDFSRMAPNMAPNPITVATKPSVLPIPFCTVANIFADSIPANNPMTILATSKARKAGNLV